ncbi:MAG: hypothetical protein KBA61_04915 [Spirochaetes bacterium]|nr:hypothetical protein [Spirochaetota bacterium]
MTAAEVPSKKKRIAVFAILLALIALYASFITADIFTGNSGNHYSRALKYATILLCLLLTLLIGRDCHDKKDRTLLQIALVLHAVGDLFMGLLGMFTPAICVFFVMQVTYIARHGREFRVDRNEIISGILILGPLAGVLAAVSPMLLKAGIFLPVFIYSLTLMTSVWIAVGTIWRKFFPRTIDWIITIAMIAFFFCDLNVGLYNSLGKSGHALFVNMLGLPAVAAPGAADASSAIGQITVMIPYTLRSIIGILVWIFYLPAVALLAFSGYRLSFIRSIFPIIPVLPEPDGIAPKAKD